MCVCFVLKRGYYFQPCKAAAASALVALEQLTAFGGGAGNR